METYYEYDFITHKDSYLKASSKLEYNKKCHFRSYHVHITCWSITSLQVELNGTTAYLPPTSVICQGRNDYRRQERVVFTLHLITIHVCVLIPAYKIPCKRHHTMSCPLITRYNIIGIRNSIWTFFYCHIND